MIVLVFYLFSGILLFLRQYHDIIFNDKQELPNESFERKLIAKGLDKVMTERLSERDKTILKLYYGLNEDERTATLEEIGQELNLTRERVRLIRDKALRRLSHNQFAKKLRDSCLRS